MGSTRKDEAMHMQTHRRHAFTIVELLVVIAIISALIGLLLPAVQAARESGRKTTCMNNLYQLGMAINRYDQDAGKVPSWSNPLGATTVSWPVVLLPYIERNDLYEQWSSGGGTAVRINTFTCPTAPPDTGNAGPLAYAGNCGDGTNVNTVTTNSKYNGVMPFPGVKYSLSDISDGDGLATTLVFAEKCKTGFQANWGLNASGVPAAFSASGTPAFSGFQQNDAACQSQLPAFGISTTLPNFGPSSQHRNGGVVAFCDGHTKFISSGLDAAIYTQLVTSRNSKVTLAAYQAVPLNENAY
jgi:prepilin-type N-terminal cleavage/methylation domain-containing protein/prepilin-type processing-associated H-X9-DG protein